MVLILVILSNHNSALIKRLIYLVWEVLHEYFIPGAALIKAVYLKCCHKNLPTIVSRLSSVAPYVLEGVVN
jgi:hypothetical protein